MRPDLATRFWAKVNKDGPIHPIVGQCWEWIGSYRNGYGQIANAGKNLRTNRVGYELQVGPIPDGKCVCHHCDNPRCIRGEHFFLGTNQENTADRQAKGRQATGARCIPTSLARGDEHWSRRMPERTTKGGDHWSSKLDDAAVADIIRRHGAGETKSALARVFGVSRRCVRLILSGDTWKHVSRGELVVEALAPGKAAA